MKLCGAGVYMQGAFASHCIAIAAYGRNPVLWCCATTPCCAACCAVLCAVLCCPVLCISERSLFTRERNDGLYTTFTSLAGKMFDEVRLHQIVLPMQHMVATWFYGAVQQHQGATFFCLIACSSGADCC